MQHCNRKYHKFTGCQSKDCNWRGKVRAPDIESNQTFSDGSWSHSVQLIIEAGHCWCVQENLLRHDGARARPFTPNWSYECTRVKLTEAFDAAWGKFWAQERYPSRSDICLVFHWWRRGKRRIFVKLLRQQSWQSDSVQGLRQAQEELHLCSSTLDWDSGRWKRKQLW